MIGLLPRPTRTLHPDDAVGFATLVAHGHEHDQRRLVHHLFLPDRDAALRASHLLGALGWSVLLCDAMPEPCPGWRLRVYRDTVIDPTRFGRSRARMVRIARMVGGTYDGWDDRAVPCELVRQSA